MNSREQAFLRKWYLLFGCEIINIAPYLFTTFNEEYQGVYLFQLQRKNLIVGNNTSYTWLYKINSEIVEKLF